ncbi:MAG: TSUP family transporter, partial [Gemmatimonadota bacterium]|nr:TSUP family transporter [Gemmatimonadota bacterium]
MPLSETATVAVLFFAMAALYASVGHGGASGYLAVMGLFGFAPAVMRPTALALNIVVALVATAQFHRRGLLVWSLFWPFAAVSIPAAFVGGAMTLPVRGYKVLVGIVLL